MRPACSREEGEGWSGTWLEAIFEFGKGRWLGDVEERQEGVGYTLAIDEVDDSVRAGRVSSVRYVCFDDEVDSQPNGQH